MDSGCSKQGFENPVQRGMDSADVFFRYKISNR